MQFTLDGFALTTPPVVATKNTVPVWYPALSILQLVLPVLFVAAGLLTADLLFYKFKLKKPLAELKAGAERMMQNDLDFSIRAFSKDELGVLCKAFEAMRYELLKNNKELWSQMEERKRLNAAFAHYLRNPITVLKGSAKMLKSGLLCAMMAQSAQDSIMLIEEYAGRIETYVEAMSSVQRLEQLQCSPKTASWEALVRELFDSIRLLAMNSNIAVEKKFEGNLQTIFVDKAILFNVAENLVANAVRYAKHNVTVHLKAASHEIVVSVQDDGNGFAQSILHKGAAPFLRAGESNEENSHFGMGLYVCRLLCEKHGGQLRLENNAKGALVTAILNTSLSDF